MKYKALFLDLDGTILDTLHDLAVAVNFSLKLHGFKERSIEEVRTFIGHGSVHLITKAIGEEVNDELFNQIFNDYKSYYKDHAAVYTTIYPRMKEILQKFIDNGGKLILITNKPHDISVNLMEHYFPNMFTDIYGNQALYLVKPDPTSCFLALKNNNLDKKDVLYLGDSLVDEQTAKNAGLDYLLCL
mgnify:FL=1